MPISKIATEISRRDVLKSCAALTSAAALAGCSKNSDESGVYYYPESGDTDADTTVKPDTKLVYGSSGHNCGGRCIIRAEVLKGRIQRFLTDESRFTSDGTYIDPESRNFPQTRACSRCRSYKYRLYHPGRLLYPMKQTVKRGDLSGFKRITWEQALNEISVKHKAVLDKYGADGIYSLYAWGAANNVFQSATPGPLGTAGAISKGGTALRYMGGAQNGIFSTYSTHQFSYFTGEYTGTDMFLPATVNNNEIARYTKHLVLWGDNSLASRNASSYGTIRAVEDMKRRNPDSKVIFIGPEFSDSGVTLADTWVTSKPYTDPALIAGMIYHMLDNTFDLSTGTHKQNAWLDVDYLDTMVYGFFDSPAYSLNETDGTIAASGAGSRDVPQVSAGKSYCSWILGNNSAAKTYSELGASSNYTAKQYAALDSSFKRWSACSYERTKGANSEYKTKKDFTVPKTPAWASAITGIPEDTIKWLAEFYAMNSPIAAFWSGGMQKQMDGIANLFALQALHIVTKNIGIKGSCIKWYAAPDIVKDPKTISVSVTRPKFNTFINAERPWASCTAWHTAIKMAYATELKEAGYRAKYIPNWAAANAGTITTGDHDIYWDDAGTKTFIMWKRGADGKITTYQDESGDTFFDWVGRAPVVGNAHAGTPVYSGIRLMYNPGGNIFINQHENSNDSREMLEYLKPNDHTSADSFCLVTIDNFLSPTARWSDYVLPATTMWEQQDVIQPTNAADFYIPAVSSPPGESKPMWDIANELLKSYERIDSARAAGAAEDFTGGVKNQTVESLVKKAFITASADSTSPFYGKTWDEYLANPYLPSKSDNDTETTPYNAAIIAKYRQLSETALLSPFITGTNKIVTNEVDSKNAVTSVLGSGLGNGYGNDFYSKANAPKSSLRFHIFSPVLVWQYENRFSKYHGYLPENKRGQQHRDIEGDRFVLEIPMYYAYEDTFMEAYGCKSQSELGALNLKYLLTTTHDRYRAHSSQAENPMLRELTHRVPGRDSSGKYNQANDYNRYAMTPATAAPVNGIAEYPTLNETIAADGTVSVTNKSIASYSEIWMNTADALAEGINDGDLIQVENPVGAVRCVARLSKRCARRFMGLHQGCWYDPRLIDGKIVDVGGNANTLMVSQPSRIDHGNGQQSAFVKVTKVNY